MVLILFILTPHIFVIDKAVKAVDSGECFHGFNCQRCLDQIPNGVNLAVCNDAVVDIVQ